MRDDPGPAGDYEDDDPNDPRHRDHDLSESADYDFDSWTEHKPWYLQRWLFLIVSVLVVLSLVLPFVVH